MSTYLDSSRLGASTFPQSKVSTIDLLKNDLLEDLKSRVNLIITGIEFIESDFYGNNHEEQKNYFTGLIGRVREVLITSELEFKLADSKIEAKEAQHQGVMSLEKLSSEWPIALMILGTEKVQKIKLRIEFAEQNFSNLLKKSDELDFQSYLQKAEKIVTKTKKNLKQCQDNDSRKGIIEKAAESLQEIRDALEMKLELYSMFDFKRKILDRIYKVTKEFNKLDLDQFEEKVEETVRYADDDISKAPQTIVKREFIKKAMNTLQDIDMEIEKKVAICEIQKRYEEVLKTIEESENATLSFSMEARDAAYSVQSSEQRIREFKENPFGMSPPVKLGLTVKGTLSALDRALNDISVKVKHAHFQEIMQMLPYSCHQGRLEGITDSECEAVEKTKRKYDNEVKKVLVWGENRMGKTLPPLLDSDEREEIIDRNLAKVSIEVCLSYAEQRIKRSLNFYLLRKEHENMSQANIIEIKEKTDNLIEEMKKNIKSTLANDPQLVAKIKQGLKIGIENTVDAIIGDTYKKLLNYCPT